VEEPSFLSFPKFRLHSMDALVTLWLHPGCMQPETARPEPGTFGHSHRPALTSWDQAHLAGHLHCPTLASWNQAHLAIIWSFALPCAAGLLEPGTSGWSFALPCSGVLEPGIWPLSGMPVCREANLKKQALGLIEGNMELVKRVQVGGVGLTLTMLLT